MIVPLSIQLSIFTWKCYADNCLDFGSRRCRPARICSQGFPLYIHYTFYLCLYRQDNLHTSIPYKLKVVEDLSNVVMLRKKLSYIESIPGVLLPHPSSSGYPFINASPSDTWNFPGIAPPQSQTEHHQRHFYHSDHNHCFLMSNHHQPQAMKITPSMSSLEALLSKLPSVVPPATQPGYFPFHHSAKEEMSQEDPNDAFRAQRRDLVGEGSNSNNNNHYNSNDSYNNNCSNNNYDRENKISGFLGQDYWV